MKPIIHLPALKFAFLPIFAWATIQSLAAAVPKQRVPIAPIASGAQLIRPGPAIPQGFMIAGETGVSPSGYSFTGLSFLTNGSASWATRAPMPTARQQLAVATVNGKVYAIGGLALNGVHLGTVEEYDPSTDTWRTMAPMPTPRKLLAAAVVNGKVYAMGGDNGGVLSVVEEFDPILDHWTPRPGFGNYGDGPWSLHSFATVALNGDIYVIGGATQYAGYRSYVTRYDPLTGISNGCQSMPTARRGLSAVAVNGKIYAIGGQNNAVGFNVVEEYNPATDTWTSKPPMPVSNHSMGVAVVNSKIYTFGGENGGVREYDPRTEVWTDMLPMPTGRKWLGAAALDEVNGRVFAIGGFGEGFTASTINEEFDPGFRTLFLHKKN